MKLVPKSFYFIRHGQTDWNEEQRLQGQTDIPLNFMGKQQAETLQALVATIPVSHVYYSPLSRAQETMHIACKHLHVPKVVLEGLKERHCGEWEGVILDKAKKETLFFHHVPVKGESYQVYHDRVIGAINAVLNEAEGLVLFVGHGGNFRVLCKAIETSFALAGNCQLFYFEAPDDANDQWRIYVL
ncbi:MAG: histidine phosphatase family protein [Candidatus Babeliales bacterium]